MNGRFAGGASADRFLSASTYLGLLWALSLPLLGIVVSEASMWLSAATWGLYWLLRELRMESGDSAPRQTGPAGDVLGLVGAPIIVFFSISLLSASLSREPVESVVSLKEAFLFAAPLVTWATFREPRLRDLGRYLFATGVLFAVVIGVAQTMRGGSVAEAPFRATGTFGHYMTYSGVLLVGIPLLLTIKGGAKTVASHTIAALAVGMIGLTLTRSAWIGCAVGLLVYYASGRVRRGTPPTPQSRRAARRRIIVVIALAAVAFALVLVTGPDALYERATTSFSLDDPTTVDRLAMAAVGMRIVSAYPLLGIGPGLMHLVYPAWVAEFEWAVRETNPHLHNNALQIAAERGLLGLVAWLWMVGAFIVVAWRVLRAAGPDGEGGPESRAALAALAGFMAMGMFEYNFGDSEVLMALLYVVSLPVAASAGLGGSRSGTERAT